MKDPFDKRKIISNRKILICVKGFDTKASFFISLQNVVAVVVKFFPTHYPRLSDWMGWVIALEYKKN